MVAKFSEGYRFLSNFYQAPVTIEDIEYPSSEHAFQAAKTLDPKERHQVACMKSSGRAKRAGSKKGVVIQAGEESVLEKGEGERFRVSLREDWDTHKFEEMLAIVRIKFNSHPHLAKWLLATEDAYLQEGTDGWNDQVWGVSQGKGDNWLGLILMQVRKEISEG
jgi:ribA/ribD-fused uncharacterized protein